SVPPGYRRSRPPARPKLDPFTGIIGRILLEDEGRPRKQRHTSKRIFERLRDEHGYSGGITIVKDYVLARRLRQREVCVPLRLDPPEPAGAGAAGGQLYSPERAAARGLSAPARRSAARSRRDDRRTVSSGSGGVPRLAASTLRRLREEGGPGQLAIAGALSRHRLLGANRLRAPRGFDPRLRPRGGDLLRGRGDRPSSALLRARGLRLRPSALLGFARTQD